MASSISFPSTIGERTRSAQKRSADDSPPPAKLQKKSSDVKEVAALSIEELITVLQEARGMRGLDYQTSIDQLKHHRIKVEGSSLPLFTDFTNPESGVVEYSQLWITVNDIWLAMRLYKGPYDSNLLAEKAVYPDAEKGSLYDFFSIFEHPFEAHSTSLLNVRCGTKGDIIWIRKGDSIGGDAVKSLCFSLLENYPFANHIYLFDDAKVGDLRLGTFLVIADPKATTWYGRNGCTPTTCRAWKSINAKDTITQDAEVYHAAVKKIRNTTLAALPEFSSLRKQSLILSFVNKYFKKKSAKSLTVHNMAKRLHIRSKQERSAAGESVASDDLSAFYHAFLTSPKYARYDGNPKKSSYTEALAVINNTILWERSFYGGPVDTGT